MRSLDGWLGSRSRATFAVAGLLAVAALGYLDFATGPELTPVVFYLLPIVPVAWYAGRGPGALVAAAAGLSWVLADALTHGGYAQAGIPYWNAAARLAVLVLVAAVVARLRGAIGREAKLARTDALTDVANLLAFYEVASAEIARSRRYRHPFTMAYVDLDGFKQVNDRLGHLAGDAVLRSVARALVETVRASDTVARMGGDEFGVLLPETDGPAARIVAGKLRAAVSGVVVAHGARVTASIGAVTSLVPPESVEALIGIADRLMYGAKRSGGDAVAHETRNEAAVAR